MRDQQQIELFLAGVRRYFEHLSKDSEALQLGAPYLVRNRESLGLDLTGMISITGQTTGFVFFSSSRSLLKYVLLSLGESSFTETYLADLVGEVANTIAGNARRELGPEFHISPPQVIIGEIDKHNLNQARLSYVLPLKWKGNAAQLIVSLDSFER
ncbi:chemotaxis protein CheX [Arenicella xantha]|uniref:Chemotaxis protein CheX n=1 Tax=Arenicella xantha TaxID=644221 RepID=A0A395JQ96_9GAMM|nr:chemotaxis protein CheX [Arenicella xantha]RBP51704.1 chemotaxis protein CheX [Arenicella xantha]